MDRKHLQRVLEDVLEQTTGTTLTSVPESFSLEEGLGLDSLGMVSLAIEIEYRLGVALEIEDFHGVSTMGDLLTLLQNKIKSPPTRHAA